MNKITKPKVYPDLHIFSFKQLIGKKNVYYMGTEENDRCMSIGSKNAKPLEKIIPLFDGNNTISDIQQKAGEKHIQLDISELTNILGRNGLLENIEGECNNEIRILGNKLIRINFSQNPKPVRSIVCRFITRMYLPVIIFLIITIALYSLSVKTNPFNCVNVSTSGVFAAVVGYLFAVFHEFGHLTYAWANYIPVEYLEVRLKFGFIPIVFIKYKGLYFIPPGKRLNLMMSGIYVHIFFALSGLAVSMVTKSVVAQSITLCNALSIINNLSPIQISDGYYAMCTVFNKHNLRIRALFTMVNPKCFFGLKKYEQAYCITYFILVVVQIFVGIIWGWQLSSSVDYYFHINHLYVFYAYLIYYCLQISFIIRKLRKMGKS
jgi:hypothetical protein